MFQTDLLSIIGSLNTVFTATGICHTSCVDCLLVRSRPRYHTGNITHMDSIEHVQKQQKHYSATPSTSGTGAGTPDKHIM